MRRPGGVWEVTVPVTNEELTLVSPSRQNRQEKG